MNIEKLLNKIPYRIRRSWKGLLILILLYLLIEFSSLIRLDISDLTYFIIITVATLSYVVYSKILSSFKGTLALTILYGLIGSSILLRLNFWDTIYFTIIAMASVGYGDIIPVTTVQKIFTVLLAIAGITAVQIFGTMATNYIKEEEDTIDRCGSKLSTLIISSEECKIDIGKININPNYRYFKCRCLDNVKRRR